MKIDIGFGLFVFTLIVTGVLMMTNFAKADEEKSNNAEAILAAGCFWCIESDLEKLDGVIEVVSGYTGGHVKNPEYKQVSSGKTGHREAVRVTYDPDTISYEKILDVFWRSHDPFDGGGQFCDRGFQYSAAIYYKNEEQKRLAEKTKAEAEKALGQKIVTAIEPASEFYDAETYHQNYYKKNPIRYKYYRFSCGRDKRTEEVWGE